MLTRTSLSAGERQLYSRLHHVLTRPGLLRGSLVDMGRTCGKRSCACHQDKSRRHHALYLAANVGGKRRMIYVPAAWEGRVREWVDRHGEIREVLEKISQYCLRRLKDRKE